MMSKQVECLRLRVDGDRDDEGLVQVLTANLLGILEVELVLIEQELQLRHRVPLVERHLHTGKPASNLWGCWIGTRRGLGLGSLPENQRCFKITRN
jgi:hypothetical protein